MSKFLVSNEFVAAATGMRSYLHYLQDNYLGDIKYHPAVEMWDKASGDARIVDNAQLVEAVHTVSRHLSEDPAFYRGWHANLVMSFLDEFRLARERDEASDLLTVANKAADVFLSQLTAYSLSK